MDGSNYDMWAQNKKVFLQGLNLWRYIFCDIPTPKQHDGENIEAFTCLLEDWHSVHYKILSSFINTLVSSIQSLLLKLGNTKAI